MPRRSKLLVVTSRRGSTRLAVLVALSFAMAGFAQGAEYRSQRWHYRLQVPEGWTEVSAERVAALNAEAAARIPAQHIHYETAFTPDAPDAANGVYVLIQIQPGATNRLSYDALEKSLVAEKAEAAVKEVASRIQDIVKEIKVGEVALDRRKSVFVTRMQIKGDDGNVSALTTGHLGANAVVTVHGYSPEAEFDKIAPLYAALNDSFEFDEGETFKPARPRAEVVAQSAGVLIGIVVGTAGAYLAIVRLRKRRAGG